MIYNSVSIENVIGRVLRNTKLTDTSALTSMYEWIPDAMELLETQYVMDNVFKDLNIKFFQAKLPMGLSILDAVQYNGKRLMLTNGVPKAAIGVPAQTGGVSVAQWTATREDNPVTGRPDFSGSLQDVSNQPADVANGYYLKLGYLCTTMKEAQVRIFYQCLPLDDNGFPLIPDNGNYKEAMYWWVRGKLIGSGELNDRTQTEDSCLAKFELYGARAVGEITYPSVDRMERIRANQLNFTLPENYWDNFNTL